MAETPIKVTTLTRTNTDPFDLASYAAKLCYQSELPRWGDRLNVEKQLFLTGHHTTLEHMYYSFVIEGVSIGDVDFGLHLTTPFYNSDQRSGRYSFNMFKTLPVEHLEAYINTFWPGFSNEIINDIISYVRYGISLFKKHLPLATHLAEQYLGEERPNLSEKSIKASAPKIAQEQERVFIPVLFPTGMVFTVDLITAATLYRTAWNPVMRYLTSRFKTIICNLNRSDEELPNFFKRAETTDWAPSLDPLAPRTTGIITKPIVSRAVIYPGSNPIIPESNDKTPLDLLGCHPKYLDNTAIMIQSDIELSLTAFGQDQRHRVVSRTEPRFGGNFYLPPILSILGLEKSALSLYDRWLDFQDKVPATLFSILAPYGATVSYTKTLNMNGFIHEGAKRRCFNAQEEIYHLACATCDELKYSTPGSKLVADVVAQANPGCYSTGVCVEGNRYCGRDRDQRNHGNYFPIRHV